MVFRRFALLGAAAIVETIAMGFGTQANDHTFPGTNGKIAFTRFTGSCENIWVMNADGSGQTNLTNSDSDSDEFTPSWSPDGTKIAFDRFSGGINQIWVMNADGSSPTNVTNDPESDDSGPAWQPIPIPTPPPVVVPAQVIVLAPAFTG